MKEKGGRGGAPLSTEGGGYCNKIVEHAATIVQNVVMSVELRLQGMDNNKLLIVQDLQTMITRMYVIAVFNIFVSLFLETGVGWVVRHNCCKLLVVCLLILALSWSFTYISQVEKGCQRHQPTKYSFFINYQFLLQKGGGGGGVSADSG